jgi:hypothetical protein
VQGLHFLHQIKTLLLQHIKYSFGSINWDPKSPSSWKKKPSFIRIKAPFHPNYCVCWTIILLLMEMKESTGGRILFGIIHWYPLWSLTHALGWVGECVCSKPRIWDPRSIGLVMY